LVIKCCSCICSLCYEKKEANYHTRPFAEYTKSLNIQCSYNVRNNDHLRNAILNLEKYLIQNDKWSSTLCNMIHLDCNYHWKYGYQINSAKSFMLLGLLRLLLAQYYLLFFGWFTLLVFLFPIRIKIWLACLFVLFFLRILFLIFGFHLVLEILLFVEYFLIQIMCHFVEDFLHINVALCACLIKHCIYLFGQNLSFFFRYNSLLFEIAFSSSQCDRYFLLGVIFDIF